MAPLHFFLLLLCGVLCPSLARPCPLNQDAAALLTFKSAILSDPLQVLATWNHSTARNCTSKTSFTSPCTWTGVRCQSHRVTALQLSGSHLIGTLSPSLAQLPFLRSLNLSSNNFSGRIPTELSECIFLASLDLSDNQLWGSIPEELGELSELAILYLYGNELSGGVPAALGNCTNLTQLDVHSNRLSGSIPAQLGALYKLQFLYLWGNELSGAVPAALGNCTRLILLHLGYNKLSGSIPAELGLLYTLESLCLYQNDLSGGVPAALGNCTNLRELDVSSTKVSGSIPAELGVLYKLFRLYLWGNELSGAVPAALGNCTRLIQLELQSNNLSGSIPAELGNLNILNLLQLQDNLFTGRVLATFTNCTNLTVFNVAGNELSDHITDEFCGIWNSLGVLALNNNLFSGRLPACLSGLKKLSRIYLQTNAFVGTIPSFSNVALNYLNISSNNLSGSIPESFGALGGLVSLDLSYNGLSGQVPSSLGSLQRLNVLNLSNNALSGNIPSTLGFCVELNTLDFSNNELTGNLPSSFASLGSLTKLDLSNNQLTGHVPNMWPYNDTMIVDLSKNPMLCGLILKRTCNMSQPKSLQEPSLDLKLIVSLIVVVIVVVLLILVLVIRGHLNIVRCDTTIDHDNGPSHALGRKAIKVSAHELQEATNGFSEANILGESGASMVYQAILADGTKVAVKVLKSELLMGMITELEVSRLKREVELLAMVRHRNVVRVLGCCFNLEMQSIVLEFVPNGNLDHYLHGMARQDAITMKEKLHLLRGIAQGLEYLHYWHDPMKTIVHCDLKPANILLDEEWEPLIADFGIAKLLQQGKDAIEQVSSLSILLRGSIGYIPPEYALTMQASCAGDVYSFGVMMLEILTGIRPTEVRGDQETLMSLVQGAYPGGLLDLFETPYMTLDESVALAELGLSCTSRIPNNRPTMIQVGRALNTIANRSK